MRALVSTVAVAAALALVTGAASAQSLGEVAARTQKEREGKAKPAKVITESDLRGRPASAGSVSQPGSGNPGAEPVASPSPGAEGKTADGKAEATKPKTPEEERAEQVAAWREKLTKAQADVTRLSGEVAELQSTLANVSAAQYSPARAKAQSRLDAAKGELAAAQASVDSLQEEGRRAGMR